MPSRNGRTTMGASDWLTNIFAVADIDSVRLVPSTRCKPPPITRITTLMMPR